MWLQTVRTGSSCGSETLRGSPMAHIDDTDTDEPDQPDHLDQPDQPDHTDQADQPTLCEYIPSSL